MTIGAARPLFLTAQGGTVPAMGTPVFLELGSGVDILDDATTSATITSASVSPPANADIFVPLFSRRDVSRTHDSVTAGFATVAGFTKIEDVEAVDAGLYFRLSLWRATTTSSPGSGTIAGSLSGTAYQRTIAGIAIPNVGSLVDSASAQNTTGTTVAATFSPGATTGDVALSFVISRSDASGTLTISDTPTHADNSPGAQSANYSYGWAHKTSPTSDTITGSGLTNNQAHAIVAALVRSAV